MQKRQIIFQRLEELPFLSVGLSVEIKCSRQVFNVGLDDVGSGRLLLYTVVFKAR